MKDFHDGAPPPPKAPKIPLPRCEEPLLEPGTYELEYVDYRTAKFMGFKPRVEVRFGVLDSRYPAKPTVKRHYNVFSIEGDPAPFGRFVPKGTSSHLVREYLTVFPDAPELDLDRFRDVRVLGSIVTVGTDEHGNPTSSNFADYSVLSISDIPQFERIVMETPTPLNPLGAKGIGEAGTIGSTPAVHNAVCDALARSGVRHIDMPTTSEKVWRAIT